MENIYFITCEHGGNRIPEELAGYFKNAGEILETHRGYDIGALEFAEKTAENLGIHLYYSTVSRLVADLNRSPKSGNLFSEFVKNIKQSEKQEILAKYYFPHRNRVESEILKTAAESRVIHIAVHSFTPVFGGKVRNAEIGLLYDSKRQHERKFCLLLKDRLAKKLPEFRIRMNYPYMGKSDCFPLYLRKTVPEDRYSGIEVEINQAVFESHKKTWALEKAFADSLAEMIERFDS